MVPIPVFLPWLVTQEEKALRADPSVGMAVTGAISASLSCSLMSCTLHVMPLLFLHLSDTEVLW